MVTVWILALAGFGIGFVSNMCECCRILFMRDEHKNRAERKIDSDLYVQRMKVRNRERPKFGSIADRS